MCVRGFGRRGVKAVALPLFTLLMNEWPKGGQSGGLALIPGLSGPGPIEFLDKPDHFHGGGDIQIGAGLPLLDGDGAAGSLSVIRFTSSSDCGVRSAITPRLAADHDHVIGHRIGHDHCEIGDGIQVIEPGAELG